MRAIRCNLIGRFISSGNFLAQYLLTRGLVHEVAGSDETADKKDE